MMYAVIDREGNSKMVSMRSHKPGCSAYTSGDTALGVKRTYKRNEEISRTWHTLFVGGPWIAWLSKPVHIVLAAEESNHENKRLGGFGEPASESNR